MEKTGQRKHSGNHHQGKENRLESAPPRMNPNQGHDQQPNGKVEGQVFPPQFTEPEKGKGR